MHKNTIKQSGFTLIELSIVLIISGLMIVAAIEAYTVYDEKRKIDQINTQMADLDQYIKNFPTMIDPATVDPVTGIGTPYGRFPCPAPMDGTGAGNDFDSEDCSITPIAGVQPDGSNGGAPVLVGKIPAATLGLHSDYMRDPHGNYLLYAVTQGASNIATYGTTSGSIQVIEEGIDRNPASATRGQIIELERHNNVQYMVVSMGDTDAGAYAFNGAQTVACPANTIKEHENCDGDARFITSLLHDRNTNDFYDDKLLFAANTVVVPNNEEPADCEQYDTVSIYGDSCPDGWDKISSPSPYTSIAAGQQQDKAATEIMAANSATHQLHANNNRAYNVDSFGFFNVDPKSGDYYTTNFKTPNSINNRNNSFDKKTITCEKKSTNKDKKKCFSKQIKTNGSPANPLNSTNINEASNPDSYEEMNEKVCPEGYKVTGFFPGPCVDDCGGHEAMNSYGPASFLCGK